MGREKKCRLVEALPPATYYKPQGAPLGGLKAAVLPVEGLEALRLADALGLSQEEAAERMGVSAPTLCRILAEARRTVARAVSSGWALRIEGGDFALRRPPEAAEDADIAETIEAAPCRRGRHACGRGRRGR